MNREIDENGSLGRSVFYLHIAILALATCVSFSNALANEFVWLDHSEIEEGGYRFHSMDEFQRIWTQTLDDYQTRQQSKSSGGYWRPIYAVSISLDYWLWQDSPVWYHAENIFLHCAVVVLLYLLGLQFVPNLNWNHEVAFLSALLFALLPINVQSVTWISGRKDILATMFGLIALHCALRSLNENKSGLKSLCQLSVSCICVAGSILCKENGFILPLVISCGIWLAQRGGIRKICLLLASVWGVAVSLWLVRYSITGDFQLSGQSPGETPMQRLLTLSCLWWEHLLTALWPYSPLLSDRWEISTMTDPRNWLALFGLLAVGILTAALFAKKSHFSVGLVWYLLWMSPTCGVLTLRHWRAERYLYPGSWGIIFLIVAVSFLLSERFATRNSIAPKPVYLFWCLVAITFGITTFSENKHWQNDQTLFSHAIEEDPNYREGHAALAKWNLDNKNYEASIKHSKLVLQTIPQHNTLGYWSPLIVHSNYGLALMNAGRLNAAEQQFRLALHQKQKEGVTFYHLGLVALKQNDLQRAEQLFRQSVEIDPLDTKARGNLAFTLLNSGRMEGIRESRDILQRILSEDSELNDIRNYGSACLVLNEWNEVIRAFQMIDARNEATASDLAKLAWGHFELQETAAAREAIDRALSLNPEDRTVQFVFRKY